MDVNATDNIKSRLNTLRAKAMSVFKREMLGVYSSRDYREFIPEFIVHEVARAAESNTVQLLTDALSKVSAISATPEAFALIVAAVEAHLFDLEGVVKHGRGIPASPTTLNVISVRFDALRQRSVRNLENHRPSFGDPRNKGGRPPKWDWEGALIHIAAVANKPDGLSSGRGAQAKIAEMIRDWFIQTTGDSPADSEIRKRAKLVIGMAGN